MNNFSKDLTEAFNEVSASSMGGAPFLIAYGATFLNHSQPFLFRPQDDRRLDCNVSGRHRLANRVLAGTKDG